MYQESVKETTWEIARQLGVLEETVSRWTTEIGNRKKMYSGRYFLALTDIINNSYYEPKRNDSNLFNALRHYVPGLEKVRGKQGHMENGKGKGLNLYTLYTWYE